MKLGYDYYFFQGYKGFIRAIEPEFFYDGIMHSNQSKMDLTDTHNFIITHFGTSASNTNSAIKEKLDAYFEGKKIAKAYLTHIKAKLKRAEFIKTLNGIKNRKYIYSDSKQF
jgi:hypothetical protein